MLLFATPPRKAHLMKRRSLRRWLWTLFPSLLAAAPAWAVPETTPRPGLRENTPNVHALRGARIVVAPGQVIESGTLVIRDGVIEAVGEEVEPPADARVWDVSGKTLYPGFIDAFGELSVDASRLAAVG
ncbi:MAG: hypothetical protein ACRD9W_30160 [Terriglobia bacterium]